MKGQVIGCSMHHFWYKSYIGRTFNIIEEREKSYKVLHPVHKGIGLFIAKEDIKLKQ